ncbi:MAG: PDZ domain-containing protein, partial [Telluria sp.]
GGVKVGDIILKFNGTAVERTGDLPRLVAATPVGSKAVVTVWRKGAQQDIHVGIVELEEDKAKRAAVKKPKAEAAPNAIGLLVSDLSEVQRRELKLDAGVAVDASEGAAARAGVRPGDLILQLNNVEVKDAKTFNAMVARLDPKKSVALLVRREESSQYVVIRPRQ